MQHIFYKTEFSISNKKKLLIESKDLSYHWWVDILDCSKSIRRQEIKMSFEDILNYLKKDSHFVFIHRRSPYEEYIEVGFSTMKTPSYFLWVYCDIRYLSYFISKYNLTKM